ncbi:MAG: hypothetical protein PHH23_06670 [Paludibacteraceae bacterium]|nr:hypothetical protein [Paludibacteraceae bacterium]
MDSTQKKALIILVMVVILIVIAIALAQKSSGVKQITASNLFDFKTLLNGSARNGTTSTTGSATSTTGSTTTGKPISSLLDDSLLGNYDFNNDLKF